MPTGPISYELWNGKESVGYCRISGELLGKYVLIYSVSAYKQLYSRRAETIQVPISYRVVEKTGADTLLRTVLDVRKKSKRQIELLKAYNGPF